MMVYHEAELHEARSIYFYFLHSEFEIFVARLIREAVLYMYN